MSTQIDIDERIYDANFITVEEYADKVGKTRQTISHHLNKGKLLPYLKKGDLVFTYDRQYYIHQDLIRLFPKHVGTVTPMSADQYQDEPIDAEVLDQSESIDVNLPGGQWLDYVRETSRQLMELSEVKGKYLMLEDGRKADETTIEDLRKRIFELEANLNQLRYQLETAESDLRTAQEQLAQTREDCEKLHTDKADLLKVQDELARVLAENQELKARKWWRIKKQNNK